MELLEEGDGLAENRGAPYVGDGFKGEVVFELGSDEFATEGALAGGVQVKHADIALGEGLVDIAAVHGCDGLVLRTYSSMALSVFMLLL